MSLEIIETVGKSEKTNLIIYRVKTQCCCCGREMIVAMREDICNDYENYNTETWCGDCAISEGKVTKKILKKLPGDFYMSVSYVPEESHKGEKPSTYQDYLKTDHWKRVRQEAVERAGNRCQLCNKPGTLHVHHRTYENIGDERPNDLIALCGYCHAKFHDKLG